MSLKKGGNESNKLYAASALTISALLLFTLFVIDLMTGPVKIPVSQVFSSLLHMKSENELWNSVLFDFRVPKALTAVAAGAALAVSGLQMQTIFRNPLAGPDVLGISSGASLGVAVVVMGFGSFFSMNRFPYFSSWMQIVAGCAGSAAVLVVVAAVSMRVRDIMTILILGILFGSAISAVVSILQYFSEQTVMRTFIIWSMGNLGSLTRSQLNALLISIFTGLTMTLFTIKKLNVLLAGETYARSLGINLRSSRLMIFFSTAVLTGSVTAFCGPVGFVGVAVPHIARTVLRSSNHRLTVPGSILAGGILLLLSDVISQVPSRDSILPVNAVTSLLGIPVVIWIIFRNRKIANLS
jgi:iron complex transport system permease protein